MKIKKFLSLILALYVALIGLATFGCSGGKAKISIRIGVDPKLIPLSVAREAAAMFESDAKEFSVTIQQYEYDRNTFTAKAVSGQLATAFMIDAADALKLYNEGYTATIPIGAVGAMQPYMSELLRLSDSQLLGIPYAASGLGVAVNLKVLYEAGIIGKGEYGYIIPNDFYDSMTSLRNALRTVTARGYTGVLMQNSNAYGGMQFMNFAWNFGSGDFQKSNGGVVYSDYNNEQCVAALWRIQDSVRNGYYSLSPYITRNDFLNNFAADKVAFALADYLDLLEFGADMNDDVAFIPLPQEQESYSLSSGKVMALNVRASEKERAGAQLLLEYLGCSPNSSEFREKVYTAKAEADEFIQPVIPVWTNAAYMSEIAAENSTHNNMSYYSFVDKYKNIYRADKSMYRYALYESLDEVLQSVFRSPSSAQAATLLEESNAAFQNRFFALVPTPLEL